MSDDIQVRVINLGEGVYLLDSDVPLRDGPQPNDLGSKVLHKMRMRLGVTGVIFTTEYSQIQLSVVPGLRYSVVKSIIQQAFKEPGLNVWVELH